MTGNKQAQSPAIPPDSFVELVKDALEHLYDFPYLQRHPLTQNDKSAAENSRETVGQTLRRDLVAAIETLSPGQGVAFRAPHTRVYNLTRLHYVEAMTVQEAAHELGISLRQAYRDLRRGEKSVATALWANRLARVPEESLASRISSPQAELDRLETHPRPADARVLLKHAQKAVERLAEQRDVKFHIEDSPEPIIVSADPVMAQQVLVNLLSHSVQQAQAGTLSLTLSAGKENPLLTLRYVPEFGMSDVPTGNDIVVQLVDRLGWTLKQEDQPGGERSVTLRMKAHGPTILVVDDNAGLVELLNRYLTGLACRVVAATSGQEGLRLAQDLTPDAILLDVMMPEMDGWEFLQRLRARPQTATTPVVICSVFNDPELAFSLGASLFLSKPVRRDDVLEALRKLGVV